MKSIAGILLGLTFLSFLPSVAHAPHASDSSPTALAPLDVWAAGFRQPRGVAVDAQGAVYVSDRWTGAVTRIAPDRSTAVVASGLHRPIGLAFDLEGRLLIAEEKAGRVVRLQTDGGRTTLIGGIKQPRWLAVGEDGTIFVSARRLTRDAEPEPDDESAEPAVIVARVPTGTLVLFADGFRQLQGIVAGDGVLYAATAGRRNEARAGGVVYEIPIRSDGRGGTPIQLRPPDSFKRPVGLALDQLGALFLTTRGLPFDTDHTKRSIGKLHPMGRLSSFADGLENPQGLAFDAAGNLYLADGVLGARVLRFRAPSNPELGPVPAFTNEPSMTTDGTAEPGSRVDGYVDAGEILFTEQADASGRFALTLSLEPNATNELSVFATTHAGDGLTSAPADATVTHDSLPPETTITSGPASPTGEATVTFSFTGADNFTAPSDLLFAWRLDSQPFSAFSAQTSTAVSGVAEGAHTFEVRAQDRAGNIAPTSATWTFTVRRFQVTLDEPAEGALVPAGQRLVRGTVEARGQEVGVTVNGVAAIVHGNAFAALVPVTPMITHLEITATTAAGGAVSREVPITVTPAPESPVVLLASPRGGVAPLTATFTLVGGPALANIEADFDGNGTLDFTGPRLDGHLFTYAQPGLYVPRVTVMDVQGQRVTVPAIIPVFDRAALDSLLQAKWLGMKDALRQGNIPQALSHIAVRSRPRYQQDFTTLLPDLPFIDSILTDLAFVRVRGPETIYEMRRADAAIVKSFEVRFHLDTDGIWRLGTF
jgi:sugar lactone lactonase YvrE